MKIYRNKIKLLTSIENWVEKKIIIKEFLYTRFYLFDDKTNSCHCQYDDNNNKKIFRKEYLVLSSFFFSPFFLFFLPFSLSLSLSLFFLFAMVLSTSKIRCSIFELFPHEEISKQQRSVCLYRRIESY